MPLLGQTARQDQEKLMQSQEKKRPTSNQKAPTCLKSCPRAKKRRHEAKIASQVTPINAFSSIYQIVPKARPTRKKKPDAQSRTLDPARTATELCTKFSAIQSFPKHLPKHSFPEIFQDPESVMDFLQEIHTQPQSKPPSISPPLLPPQDSTSYHPASSLVVRICPMIFREYRKVILKQPKSPESPGSDGVSK